MATTLIKESGLSVRTSNYLIHVGGFTDMEQVRRAMDQNLLRIENFGTKCLNEVREWLQAHPGPAPTPRSQFHERLEKALHSAEFARDDLRGALAAASAMESLVIMPMIASAATLVTSLQAALAAVRSTE